MNEVVDERLYRSPAPVVKLNAGFEQGGEMNRLKVTWELIQGADGKKYLNMHWNSGSQTHSAVVPQGKLGEADGHH